MLPEKFLTARRGWLVTGLVGLLLIVAAVAVLRGAGQKSSSSTQPKITWSESQIQIFLAPGEFATRRVSLTSPLSLEAATVDAVPELAGFLTPQPTELAALQGGTRQRVKLLFRIPADTPLGTYEGTVHLRVRSRTVPETLKIALTVGEATLPPDPGEAGKATLEGFDSDGDGVRDDIERYIVSVFEESPATQAALYQFASIAQSVLAEADDRDASIANTIEMFHARECLTYVRGLDATRMIVGELRAQLLNTPARSNAWIRADRHFGGQFYTSVPIPERKSQCEFDPDEL